ESSLARRPPANVETALYRVVQESLTNVVRHARARNATIQLARRGKGNLRCSIRDDGSGFDVASTLSNHAQGGLGLVGIRERLNAVGGSLQIHSQPGRGTELIADVPDEVQYVSEALRAGVKGYVLKNQAATDLVEAIHQVGCGGIYLSPHVSRAVVEAYLSKSNVPVDPLTPRERQVLQMVGEGRSTKD